jgi:hypothetical protein
MSTIRNTQNYVYLTMAQLLAYQCASESGRTIQTDRQMDGQMQGWMLKRPEWWIENCLEHWLEKCPELKWPEERKQLEQGFH